MYTDPKEELTLEQRIKLYEEESRRRNQGKGELTINVISIIVFVAFVVLLPAMVNYFLSKPDP